MIALLVCLVLCFFLLTVLISHQKLKHKCDRYQLPTHHYGGYQLPPGPCSLHEQLYQLKGDLACLRESKGPNIDAEFIELEHEINSLVV